MLIVTEDYLPRDNGNASLQNTVFQHVWEEVDTEIQVKGFKNMNASTCNIICINIYLFLCHYVCLVSMFIWLCQHASEHFCLCVYAHACLFRLFYYVHVGVFINILVMPNKN